MLLNYPELVWFSWGQSWKIIGTLYNHWS